MGLTALGPPSGGLFLLSALHLPLEFVLRDAADIDDRSRLVRREPGISGCLHPPDGWRTTVVAHTGNFVPTFRCWYRRRHWLRRALLQSDPDGVALIKAGRGRIATVKDSRQLR